MTTRTIDEPVFEPDQGPVQQVLVKLVEGAVTSRQRRPDGPRGVGAGGGVAAGPPGGRGADGRLRAAVAARLGPG